jgi:hypothetical protein
MKIIIEIENEDEIRRVEKTAGYIRPKSMKVIDKTNKIKEFLDFIDKKTIIVDKITIPSREERHER